MARKIQVGLLLVPLMLAVISILYVNQSISSKIIISDHMSEFIDLVDKSKVKNGEKIIIFDIDDTTIMSSKLIGTPNWFYTAFNMIRQAGAARNEAYQVVSDIDRVIQENVSVRLVENSTLNAIKSWKEQGAIIVALTSRPAAIAKTTEAQLAKVGLNFSSPRHQCIEEKWKPKLGVFQNGVIYAGDFSAKLEAFKQFYTNITRCGISVGLIAHADDQQHYVSEISHFAKEHRLAFVGIIYGGAVVARGFDLGKANQQLFELEATIGRKIMPDQYREIFSLK